MYRINADSYFISNDYEMKLFWVKNEDVKMLDEESLSVLGSINTEFSRKIAKEKGEPDLGNEFEISRTLNAIEKKVEFFKNIPEEAEEYLSLKKDIKELELHIKNSKKEIQELQEAIRDYEEEVEDLKELSNRSLKIIEINGEVVHLDNVCFKELDGDKYFKRGS